jgi:hypothetical protein
MRQNMENALKERKMGPRRALRSPKGLRNMGPTVP